MSTTPHKPHRDEDAVAEIPPGEESPGSVQGGGSEILASGSGASGGSGGSAQTAGSSDVGTLEHLEAEVIQEDKGATGD